MTIYEFKDLSRYDKLKLAPKDKYHKCVCEATNTLNALAYELELCTAFWDSDKEILAHAKKVFKEYKFLQFLKSP